MRYIGVDLGDVRTGVAVSDASAFLASGLVVLRENGLKKTASKIVEYVREYSAAAIVVGNPLNTDGSEGERSAKARAFCDILRNALSKAELNCEVLLTDERYTSCEAHELLSLAGNKGKKHRDKVDMVAAELILQGYLDSLRDKQ